MTGISRKFNGGGEDLGFSKIEGVSDSSKWSGYTANFEDEGIVTLLY